MYLKFIRKNPKNPVLISVPHAGNFYPELFLKYLKLNLNEVRKIEDFKSDEILNLINKDSADVIIAQCSRAVIDLNRSRKAIDNNMFSETTVDLLVNLHLTDRKSSKLSGYKVIKFLNLAIEEISEFEKVIGLTKTSCTKVLIEKIKKNIFSGRIEISLCALLYCSFYWPETLLLKN